MTVKQIVKRSHPCGTVHGFGYDGFVGELELQYILRISLDRHIVITDEWGIFRQGNDVCGADEYHWDM